MVSMQIHILVCDRFPIGDRGRESRSDGGVEVGFERERGQHVVVETRKQLRQVFRDGLRRTVGKGQYESQGLRVARDAQQTRRSRNSIARAGKERRRGIGCGMRRIAARGPLWRKVECCLLYTS